MRNCYHDPCGCGYLATTGQLVHLCRQHTGRRSDQTLPPAAKDTLYAALLPFITLFNENARK